jgi:hypothetical protein
MPAKRPLDFLTMRHQLPAWEVGCMFGGLLAKGNLNTASA